MQLVITVLSCEVAVVDAATNKIKAYFLEHELPVKGPMKIKSAYGPLPTAKLSCFLDPADIVRLMRRRLWVGGEVTPDLITGMQFIGIPSTCKLEFLSES